MKYYLQLLFLTLIPFSTYAEKDRSFQSKGKDFKVTNLFKTNDVIWGFDFIDARNLIFTEKSGKLKILNLDTQGTLNLKGLPSIAFGGQGGLLDVAYHKQNKNIYFTYSKKIPEGTTTALAKAKVSNQKLSNVETIFIAKTNSSAGQHFGSRIAFKDQYLFIGIGDRGKRHEAQSLTNHQGTIVRLNLDGSVPESNPYFNSKQALPEIWSYGHRNPQGLAIDHNGKLWEAEFGPRGGDEINLIWPAKNYGWPKITYGREYHGPKIGTTHATGMEQPIIYYTPSISPSGINFYTGDRLSAWKNNLFVANLSSQHLRRLVISKDKIVKQEVLLEELNERIRQVRMGPDERLFFSTDSGLIAAIDLE